MTLFLEPEQVAPGRTHATLHRSGGARRLSVRRADHAGARDLHQRVGLDEVDISLGEGGTLLLPPSPAMASLRFPTRVPPPPLARCGPVRNKMVAPVLHVLPLTIRSTHIPMITLLLRAFRDYL